MLFSCIERLLAFLNVKSLVLPAAEEAESIWTDKFGFEKMKTEQVCYHVFALCILACFQTFIISHFCIPCCSLTNTEEVAVRWWHSKGHLCFRKWFRNVESSSLIMKVKMQSSYSLVCVSFCKCLVLLLIEVPFRIHLLVWIKDF